LTARVSTSPYWPAEAADAPARQCGQSALELILRVTAVLGTTKDHRVRFDQFVFRELIYRQVTTFRGQRVIPLIRCLEQTQWLPRPELQRIQLTRLQELLRLARKSSAGYRRRLVDVPGTIRSLAALRDVPTLTKQQLRTEHAELQTSHPGILCVQKTTGGSTGEPVTLLKSRVAMAWELAATWRGYGWAKVGVGDRQARFWGIPLDSRNRMKAHLVDFVCHRRRFSAFDFEPSSFSDYERRLAKFRPDWFYGYASMLAEFARWYIQNGRTCAVRPRAIVTTSEVLASDDRSAIERAFQSRVFNEYGCGELGTVAHECPEGTLHINDEDMIVEILDGERTCDPGEKGELVVTELNNLALPLVRYRTGDFASFKGSPCRCGRSLAALDQLYGRAYDFVITPSGRKFHAEFLMYVFEEAQRHQIGIAQFQVQQERNDLLTARVVPATYGFTREMEAKLVDRIRRLLGNEMCVRVERVDHINREPSGKMRVIVGLEGAGTQ
jgi:phenylacetate-CoA ligase